ncbi:glycosyltransferase family 2 protein [Bowmanella pacifica]|uniref:Rhamnosyltransferase n=1 Tax=Bowmanella pacifica TaxID=502051 RepID=A0A918DF94_9ALTE|nr:glycosyltransferase family 2 protein [Bowmanella pacifica]GGO63548.1 rhamnosyltransferase [Bowmanella pacifica]
MKIGAVVILYKPELNEAKALLDNLAQQVDALCIVDNSPESTYSQLALAGYENQIFFHFPDNIGIASAQNVGLQHLLKDGCDFGLLFDQDSQFDIGFVAKLAELFQKSRQHYLPRLVALGPSLMCSYTKKIVRPKIQTEIEQFDDISSVPQIIASGMMIDLHWLQQIGLKDDALFIDGVDHEWCWRARKHGFSVGLALDICMSHKLGDGRRRFAGITYKVGAPVRLYYQFRNIFLLSRRSYVPLYWKFRNFAVMPLRIFTNCVLLPDRMMRLRYMLQGIIDGMLNRSGPIKASAKRP